MSFFLRNVDFPNFSQNDGNFPNLNGPGPSPKKWCESPDSTLTPAAAAAIALNEKEKDTVPFESFSLNELKKETLSSETSLTAATGVDGEEVVTPKSVILSEVKKETSQPFEEESKSVELEIEEVGPVTRSMARKRLQMD